MSARMDYEKVQTYIDQNPNKKWKEDLRLPCISEITNDNIMEHIMQYTIHYGKLMENKPAIVNYLDFGFIPVAFYPTCYAEENEKIDRMIEKYGINVHKFPAIYAGDVRFRNAHTDSWVSRFDIGELFNIPPEQVRTSDILGRFIYSETA